jgi:uncharacterized membrane protein YbhN (UPF0104 family)
VKRAAWAWARLLGGTGIVAVLLWRLGASAFLDGLRVIDGPTLLAALGIGALTTVCSAWRWSLVAGGLGVRLPLRVAVADYYRALFLNAALPGGVLGDVHRAVRHGRDVGDVGRGIRAVVLERCAGQLVLVTVAAAVLVADPPAALTQVHLGIGPRLTGVAVGLGAAAVLLVTWLRRSRVASWWDRAVQGAVGDIRRGLFGRDNWAGVMIASVVVLAGHLATFLVAARAVGSTAPIGTLLPMMLLALLAMGVPLNIGGWGPREGVAAWAFGAAGLGASQGLTIAVVYGLLALVASLPGAGVLAVRWIGRPAPAAPVPALAVAPAAIPVERRRPRQPALVGPGVSHRSESA